jgi:hypothetical protein
VRLVIDDEGAVQDYYTYEPFGQTIESGGTLDNSYRFTGQYFDSEIEEYYLRVRSPGDISVGDRPRWDMHYNPPSPASPPATRSHRTTLGRCRRPGTYLVTCDGVLPYVERF